MKITVLIPTFRNDGTKIDDLKAELLIRDIGKQLGQKAMWLELQYFDGVRILKID